MIDFSKFLHLIKIRRIPTFYSTFRNGATWPSDFYFWPLQWSCWVVVWSWSSNFWGRLFKVSWTAERAKIDALNLYFACALHKPIFLYRYRNCGWFDSRDPKLRHTALSLVVGLLSHFGWSGTNLYSAILFSIHRDANTLGWPRRLDGWKGLSTYFRLQFRHHHHRLVSCVSRRRKRKSEKLPANCLLSFSV